MAVTVSLDYTELRILKPEHSLRSGIRSSLMVLSYDIKLLYGQSLERCFGPLNPLSVVYIMTWNYSD